VNARPQNAADDLLGRFEAATIDPEAFDHRTHIEVAWRYLGALPALAAAERMAAGLRRLTASLGQPARYHETVTAFFVLLIAERRRKRPADSFEAFCRQNPDLLDDARELLLRHYSRSRLDSELARSQFLLPDRAGRGLQEPGGTGDQGLATRD